MAPYTAKHEAISIVNERPCSDVTKICFILAFICLIRKSLLRHLTLNEWWCERQENTELIKN